MYAPLILLFSSLVAGNKLRIGVAQSRMSNELLFLAPYLDTRDILACHGSEIISCVAASVNWDSLRDPILGSIILPTGEELFETRFLDTYGERNIELFGEAPESFEYKNEAGAEAVLTFKGDSLYGDVESADGRDFVIESVNKDFVLWKEIDQSEWKDEPPLVAPASARELPHMRMDELTSQGRDDETTIVEFSVTVYYTAGFKASTTNPNTFIDQVIAETNAGYQNSQIPLRIKLHCIAESDIPDGMSNQHTLDKLSEGNDNDIRKSADVAILLVNNFDDAGSCGLNFFDVISSGHTFGTVRKVCALGYYSFGHEIGHGLGLNHDRRVATQSSVDYGFGLVIEVGRYRSIMSYATNHETRINYYSNPDVHYLGLPTGTSEANNARVLINNRFAAANIGDESMACHAIVSPTPPSPPTTAPPSPPTTAPPSTTIPPMSPSFETASSEASTPKFSLLKSTTTSSSPACSFRDSYSNCVDLAKTFCYQEEISSLCAHACGLCPGGTPVASNTCYNHFSNCQALANQGLCSHPSLGPKCTQACGKC